MGRLAKYQKSESERKVYQIDYTDWLNTGEAVQSVAFDITPTTVPPLVIDTISVLPTALGVQYFISGGLDATTYEATATMTTNQTQVREDAIVVVVREP